MKLEVGERPLLGVACALLLLASACYSGVEGDPGEPEAPPAPPDTDGDDPDDRPPGADDPDAACSDEGPDPLRRLTRTQYVRSVEALTQVEVPPDLAERLQPVEAPEHGFANAAAGLIVRQSDTDAYQRIAEAVARLRFDAASDPAAWVGCAPDAPSCLREFILRWGRLAFRRPIEDAEVDRLLSLTDAIPSDELGAWSPYAVALEAMLQSPHFILVIEPSEDTEEPLPLDGYQIATRLALALWDQAPDEVLLDRAERGELDEPGPRQAVIDQMLADPRSDAGLRRFAEEWFELAAISDAPFADAPDPATAERWRQDAQAEVLARLERSLVGGDLREVYVGRKGRISPALASLYGVSVDAETTEPAGGTFEVDFPPQSRRGGLFTTAGFLATHASGPNASVVRRGAYARRVALCSEPPPPPPDVEVTEDADLEHASKPECWGCHEMLDPIGWGLDRYGPSGRLRTEHPDGTSVREDGYLLEFNRAEFSDGVELGEAVIDSPAFAGCAVTKSLTWVQGRAPSESACLAEAFTPAFEAGGFSIRDLFGAILAAEASNQRFVPPAQEDDE